MSRVAFKELIQRQRKHLRDAQKAHREQLTSTDHLALALRRESDLIVRAYRVVNGSLQPAGRRKLAKQNSFDTDTPYTPQLRDLIDRAQQGDETAVPKLIEQLDESPGLWQQVGDLAKHVETAWVKLLAGGDLLTQECLQREAERRRTELLGDDPTPIERHLVERIVATWLQVQHAEMQMGSSQGETDSQLNFRHRRLESAQKQHRAAIDQLVKIRELTRAKKQKPLGTTQKSGRDDQTPTRTRHRIVAA